MSLLRMIAALVEKELRRREEARRAAIDHPFGKPPPRVSEEMWRTWHRYGWVVCPGRSKRVCLDPACAVGAECKRMAERGLAGDGSALKRKLRPTCGARTRNGEPCQVRVEPGTRRCRFHGGLSTGPRTEDGKARIAEAQRRRWAAWRAQTPILRETARSSIRPRRGPAAR